MSQQRVGLIIKRKKSYNFFDATNNRTARKILKYLDLIVNKVNQFSDMDTTLIGGSKDMSNEEYAVLLNSIYSNLKTNKNTLPVFMTQFINGGSVDTNSVLYNTELQNGGGSEILRNLNNNLSGGERNSYLINKLEKKQDRLVKNSDLIKQVIHENVTLFKHSKNDISNLINRFSYDKSVADKLELSIVNNLYNLVN